MTFFIGSDITPQPINGDELVLVIKFIINSISPFQKRLDIKNVLLFQTIKDAKSILSLKSGFFSKN
jgi:hypothetical protein